MLNFYLMSLSVKRALGRGVQGKNRMLLSYILRMFLMVAIMAVGILCPYFHWIAVIVPYLFPSLTICAMRFLHLYEPGRFGEEEK